MEIYSTSACFADEWLFAEPSGTLTSVRAGIGLTARRRLRASLRPIAVAFRCRVIPAWLCGRRRVHCLPATFSYKPLTVLQGISILITVGPMSPCVSTCSRIFSNFSALLTSPRIASENSFRILASSRDPRRTRCPSRYSISSDRTLRMMFAISVESRFPRPFGFGQTPFLNRV